MTPCGERFFSLGVNVLDGGYPEREEAGKIWYSWKAFAPTLADWAAETRQRLFAWGFNSAGGWALPPETLKLPTIINLELGRLARFHWFDPFDPETEKRMNALARELVAPYRGSPYRIGYFSDNEVGWWAGALFVFYSAKPANSFTKQRWVEMLRQHYAGDWSRFTADFLPPAGVASWEALLATTERTRMRPGGEGIHVGARMDRHRRRALLHPRRAGDPRRRPRRALFRRPAADLLRPGGGAGDGAACRRDCRRTTTSTAATAGSRITSSTGCRKLSGGKPVLISEWFFAARENRTGNRNNGHLMTVATQTERAVGAAAATLNFAAIPEIIGAHWFQYYDHPKGGRRDGEDYDFGLVDINDQPYQRLTSDLAIANRRVRQVHAGAATSRRRQRRRGLSRCRTRPSPSTIIRSPIGRSRPACCRGSRPRRERSSSAKLTSRGASKASRWRRSDRITSTSTFSPMRAVFR